MCHVKVPGLDRGSLTNANPPTRRRNTLVHTRNYKLAHSKRGHIRMSKQGHTGTCSRERKRNPAHMRSPVHRHSQAHKSSRSTEW